MKILRKLKRLLGRPRIRIGRIAGIQLFLRHEEFIFVSAFLILKPSPNVTERVGLYSAFLLLVVVHELGHVLFGAMRGWKTRGLTFGIWNGLCEFRQDHAETDAATHLKNVIIVSWGGVVAEFLIVLVTISLFALGLWPEGSFFRGVFHAFTWFAAASIVLNLLPINGIDGDYAWAWIRWKRNLKKHETPDEDESATPQR